METETSVIALAASPAFQIDGTCFAASQSGLLKTVDHGHTWSPLFYSEPSFEQIPTTAVALSPAFARDPMVLASIPGGIGRSTDRGTTWQFVRLPAPPPLVTSFVISPSFINDRLAFAATMQDGIFRTDDGGETWTAWNSGLFDMSVLALAISPSFANDQTIFAGTSTGIFRSTNRGRAWKPVDIYSDFPAILSLAILPLVGAGRFRVLAAIEGHGLASSSDSDYSWTAIDERVVSGTIHTIAVSPANAEPAYVLILSEDALMYSADCGKSWHTIEDLPRRLAEITAIAVPSGSPMELEVLIGTIDGFIYRIVGPR